MQRLTIRIVSCCVCPCFFVISALLGADIGLRLLKHNSAKELVSQAEQLAPGVAEQVNALEKEGGNL